MKILRNLKEHVSGLIECEILLGEEWHGHAIKLDEEYKIHESSEWSDIKPSTQAEKDAYAAQEVREQTNLEARSYLSSTDWYVTRNVETGEPVPQDVLVKRAEARLKVINV